MPRVPAARLELPWEGRTCPALVGPGALARIGEFWDPGWRRAALIGDARVMELHGEAAARRLRPLVDQLELRDFPPGEASKTRATKEALEDHLLARGLTRETCLVGIGGGISLDLAGFVAATYMRGVPHVNIPTSLLAQVDAAVGGKTGVNTPRGKNLIGAFHHPAAVIIDSDLLATLPPAEWRCGLGEVVKIAFVADPELFSWLERHAVDLRRPGAADPRALGRCVELKARVVADDEREAGRRRILNFGHTVGHALEGALDHRVSHGEAVALGMGVEARLARELCGLPAGDEARLGALIEALGLERSLPAISPSELAPFLGLDKKRQGDRLLMSLPRALGRMAGAAEGYTVAVTRRQLERAWGELSCSA